MSNAIESKDVSLASIFDPYVAGTTQARAAGIQDGGADTSTLYANIIYGSAAAATGIQSKGADLNTLYAAKGTASYALPINGNSYDSQYIIPAGETGSSFIEFSLTGSSGAWIYNVTGLTSAGQPKTFASGPCPAAATSVMFTWGSYTIDTGDSLGSTTNQAASQTTISNGISANYSTAVYNDNTGTRGRIYNFTITLYSAAGAVISTTNIKLEASVDGSV